MRMLIAHTGRTGKDSSITFDTDREVFCRGRAKNHNAFIYAEKKSDVDSVVYDLTHSNRVGGFVEVSIDEFEHGLKKVTTKREMKELCEGNEFFVKGVRHVASVDSHLCDDATCDEYVVYDEDGESWFESDFPETA